MANKGVAGPTVEVTLRFREKTFMDIVEACGWKIKDKAAFSAFLQSPEFNERLAKDLFNSWDMINEEDVGTAFESLFEEKAPGIECDW